MSEARLRELERRLASGDSEAVEEFAALLGRLGRRPPLLEAIEELNQAAREAYPQLRRPLDWSGFWEESQRLLRKVGELYMWRVDGEPFSWCVSEVGKFWRREVHDHPDHPATSYGILAFACRRGEAVTIGLGAGRYPRPSPGKAWPTLAPWRGVSSNPDTVARKCAAWAEEDPQERATCPLIDLQVALAFVAREGANREIVADHERRVALAEELERKHLVPPSRRPSDSQQSALTAELERKQVAPDFLEILLLSHCEGKPLTALDAEDVRRLLGVIRAL